MASIRQWATPVTIGAFFFSGTTGMLMFFHWQSGIQVLAHEWLGGFLITGGLAHAIGNGNAFANYFKQPVARGVLATFALLLIASFFIPAPPKNSPQAVAMKALADTPLTLVAQVAKKEPSQLLAQLRQAGFKADTSATTIHTITHGNKQAEKKAWQVVFQANPE